MAITYRSAGGFMMLVTGSANPTDGQTLYLGPAAVAVDAVQGIQVPVAARLKKAYLTISVAGTLGTTEQATASVRVNSTDNDISTTVQFNAVRQAYTKTDFDVSVAAGDFLVLKVVHPTFVTNPTSVVYTLSLWFERDGT